MDRTRDFLIRHEMHPDQIDMERTVTEFREEMRSGLDGEASSLMMLPAYLNPAAALQYGKPVVVLDAGGTNLRIALVTFHDGKTIIENERKVPMPGTGRVVAWREFLEELAAETAPLAQNVERLGVCFSFPAKITPDIDGEILCFNKEVAVVGGEGKCLCKELIEVLNRDYGCNIHLYALLNDTVAALLGGFGAERYGKYDGYIGFILGTGMNCCYVEPRRNMVINMEAGGYGEAPQGSYHRLVDAKSANPGEHLIEKMVSGGYLGAVIFETLCGACQEGLFSEQFDVILHRMETITMQDVSAFLEDPTGNNLLSQMCCGQDDCAVLWELADKSLERAAKLIAAALTGIMEQADIGKLPWKPACIVTEGSTFWKCRAYRTHILHYLRVFAAERCGRYAEIIETGNANLCGAAAAVLIREAAPVSV